MPEALAGGPLAAPHAAFVLLAEFNIDTGSGLKHQYPQPTGTSELWARILTLAVLVLIFPACQECWLT